MKRLSTLLSFSLMLVLNATNLYAQEASTDQSTELDAIQSTLLDYIMGSSFNNLEQLERAFTENATLYLTLRDGQFSKLTPKEYVAFFEGREEGVYNGRDGKILGIDIDKDIASAKVEILFTGNGSRYIDIFLLKKIDGMDWKIISKTATRVDEGG